MIILQNKFNQKALFISITTFAFMSTASANGKWIISGNSLLNLNNYSIIQKRNVSCINKQPTGLFIMFSGDSEFKLSVASCTKFKDGDAKERLDDTFEEIIDFLKDDDEYLVLD